MERAAGLAPGERYRCGACGNLTRFDVQTSERVRRYWHAGLSGEGTLEDTEQLEVRVESVTCRWCGSPDQIEIVPVPGVAPVGTDGQEVSGRDG